MTKNLAADKIVLITGGASGIGEAAAKMFAEHGASVVIADVQIERGKYIADNLQSSFFIPTDVRDESQVEAAVVAAVEKYGRLDCMINNAGSVGAIGSIALLSNEDWRATIALLLDSVFYGMKHAAKVMIPRRTGCILSLSSVAGLIGGVGPHAYTAAKHGILGLTKSVASELAQHGIRVNSVAPGLTVTPLISAARGGAQDAAERSAKTSRLNSPIMPSDIAGALLFLASDLSRQVTGQTVFVDGGVSTIYPTPTDAVSFHQMKSA